MSWIRSLGYLRIESADSRPGASSASGCSAWSRAGGPTRRGVPAHGRLPRPAGDHAGGAGAAARHRLGGGGRAGPGRGGQGAGGAGVAVKAGTAAEPPSAGWRSAALRRPGGQRPGDVQRARRSSTARRSVRTATVSSRVCSGWAMRYCRCPTASPRCASTPRCSGSGCGTRCGWRRSCSAGRRRAAAVDAVPRLQSAAPLARAGAVSGPGRDRAPDDRGRRAGRRGPGHGPVRPAWRPAQRDARPARQRPDGVVLRATPGGFDIEYGTDGRLVDDATWVAGRPPRSACGATSSPPRAGTEAGAMAAADLVQVTAVP